MSHQKRKNNSSGSPNYQKKLKEESKPEEDQEDDLGWRSAFSQSLSDWTIKVTNAETKEVSEYPVHKITLTSGCRKSEYFVSLFQNGSEYKESQESVSHIELDPLVADAFESLLDYLYFPTKPLCVTRETATALHHLGEYFDMKYLRWDALQFIKQDISMENAADYYDHATQLRNDAVLEVVAHLWGTNILSVWSNSSLFEKTMDPTFFAKIVEYTSGEKDHSLHISALVAAYANANISALDAETFQRMTSPTQMPIIHTNAAMNLIQLEETILKKEQTESLEHISSCLQQRCVKALTKSWRHLDLHDKYTKDLFRERGSTFLVELLAKCMDESRQALEKCETELDRMKRKIDHPWSQTQNSDAETSGDSTLRDSISEWVASNRGGSRWGVSFDSMVRAHPGSSEGQVRRAINDLLSEGIIYTTIHENLFRSHL